jgi:hypothetical protein
MRLPIPLIVLLLMSSQAAAVGEEVSPWETLEAIVMPKPEVVFRVDFGIKTPTETWGVKFTSFRDWLKNEHKIDVDIQLTPDVAMWEVKGWDANPNKVGCHARNIKASEALALVCDIQGFTIQKTDGAILIAVDKKEQVPAEPVE